MIMEFPVDADQICFGHRSRKAARSVTRYFNERLRPIDIQITQLSILIVLSSTDGLSVAALAERLDLEASALLRNLKLLEERGLVAGDGGRGRNGRRTRLTKAARTLLSAAAPLWTRAQADLSAALGEEANQARQTLLNLEEAALHLSGESR